MKVSVSYPVSGSVPGRDPSDCAELEVSILNKDLSGFDGLVKQAVTFMAPLTRDDSKYEVPPSSLLLL